MFLLFRKNTEKMHFHANFNENLKGQPFLCQKCVNQKYLWRRKTS